MVLPRLTGQDRLSSHSCSLYRETVGKFFSNLQRAAVNCQVTLYGNTCNVAYKGNLRLHERLDVPVMVAVLPSISNENYDVSSCLLRWAFAYRQDP